MPLLYHHPTPAGTFCLTVSRNALIGLTLSDHAPLQGDIITTPTPLHKAATDQLDEYFAGARRTFTLPIRLTVTPFTRQILSLLPHIPYGTTLTYGELANRCGHPHAAQAVGQALGRNPLLILLPCHRVTAAHHIGGFNAGLALKQHLLTLEATFAGTPRPRF